MLFISNCSLFNQLAVKLSVIKGHKIRSKQKTPESILKEKLISSELRYRRLFESAKDGILILDAITGKIIDANPFLINLLGFTKEEFIEKEIWQIGLFRDIAANKEKFQELKQQEYVRYENLPLETADGRKINVEFVSNVYLENHKKIIQCNIRDITERKKKENALIDSELRRRTLLQTIPDLIWLKDMDGKYLSCNTMFERFFGAREKAEESDLLKTAFLANMSHEIRTSMNGILGFTELLKEPMLTGEEQKEYIDIIEKSGARMLNIINNIVSMSKIESGQMEITISETDINEQLEYIFNFFKPEAEKKNLQISYKNPLPSQKTIIKTDKEKVTAILINLVENAIKFTTSGFIKFGYEKKANWLEFFVKDTGTGVTREQKDSIFERFRQGSESLSRNYEGAGLGLSISKAYVELLGGKIWVDDYSDSAISNIPGKRIGSIFCFTIPYYPKQQENIAGDREKAIAAGCNEYVSKPINLATLNNLIKKLFT